MSGWLLIIILLVLMGIGVPIGIALGVCCLGFFLVEGLPLSTIPRVMMSMFETFPFLAIPFFALAGELMNIGGVTDRLFSFAKTLVGHIPGALGHANVVASMLFAGMSGSAVADSAGLGTVEIKAMKEDGYDDDFSAAITAASSTIGPIIPPSIPFVIYGAMTNTSVGALFLGGLLPGVVMGLALMVVVYYISLKRGYKVYKRATLKELWSVFLQALPTFVTPAIILGGILFGIATPTESAVLAVLYAAVLGVFVYHEMSFLDLLISIGRVARTVGSVVVAACAAFIFAWVLTYTGLPQDIASALAAVSPNKYVFLAIVNVLLLVIGCFMDTTAALVVTIPVLLPAVQAFGINTIHFGVMAVLNLMLGLLTPPVGLCAYLVSDIAKCSFERVIKALVPFIIILVVVLVLITYIPEITMFLPNLVLK